jgi:hypothetical protein
MLHVGRDGGWKEPIISGMGAAVISVLQRALSWRRAGMRALFSLPWEKFQ